ncbi:hypothetical protein Q9L58_006096 [Maublancomyces gigas]|uniref:Uncharacterized protein n=1 Tax=Discina gigas TaxID=1032678 RepID=A0ABR3GG95_9PEZI
MLPSETTTELPPTSQTAVPAPTAYPAGDDKGQQNLPQTTEIVSDPESGSREGRASPQRQSWVRSIPIPALLLLGIIAAVLHHVFYITLHYQNAGAESRQRWVSRIGAGLAFLCYTCFVAALTISRDQVVWMTLREDSFTLRQIDALFGASSGPLHLFHRDIFRRARTATFMALIIYIIPLTAILTPSSITVQPSSKQLPIPCVGRSVRYKMDNESTAILDPLGYAFPIARTRRGDYDGPTDWGRSSAMAAAYSWNESYYHFGVDACPKQTICRYNTTVMLPGMTCAITDQGQGKISTWAPPLTWSDHFDNLTVEAGKYPIFLAQRDHNNTGALWVAHTWPSTKPNDTDIVSWGLILCRNAITRYTLTTTFISRTGALYKEPKSERREHLQYVDGIIAALPPKIRTYDLNIAFFDVAAELLEGSMVADLVVENFGGLVNSMNTTRTKANSIFGYRLTTGVTSDVLVDLMEVISYNMASIPPLFHGGEGSATINTMCDVYGSVYRYKPLQLLVTYGAAAFATTIMVIFGVGALGVNGGVLNGSFSTIFFATRNPTLDRIVIEASIDGTPSSRDLNQVKMRFGELATHPAEGRTPYAAMGVENDLRDTQKKRWRFF